MSGPADRFDVNMVEFPFVIPIVGNGDYFIELSDASTPGSHDEHHNIDVTFLVSREVIERECPGLAEENENSKTVTLRRVFPDTALAMLMILTEAHTGDLLNCITDGWHEESECSRAVCVWGINHSTFLWMMFLVRQFDVRSRLFTLLHE